MLRPGPVLSLDPCAGSLAPAPAGIDGISGIDGIGGTSFVSPDVGNRVDIRRLTRSATCQELSVRRRASRSFSFYLLLLATPDLRRLRSTGISGGSETGTRHGGHGDLSIPDLGSTYVG
jgi:hypothetical protein